VAAVDRDGAAVSLVDAETREVRRTLALGTHPRACVWDAWNPRWLYVAVEDDDSVVVIDRTLGAIVRELPVGRLPSGLAVSAQRNELAVLHRIDGKISLVDLAGVYSPADQGLSVSDFALADQPAASDPKVPQGRPFAFESLAWSADGTTAWIPHELLASRQPFVFNETIFPAVSVADVGARAEVTTDPTTGIIAGRKVLFDAINLLDPQGNPMVFSQPCAAAFHPNGLVAYALACGSEDLVTFDVTAGTAIDALRDLPGDHPVGLALDDKGQRAFVLFDQSHSLAMIDLAQGSPIHHANVAGTPIALVAKDPVDAETREGLKLFFRANSTKGDLATTGNDWMSCAACHLDGLVSTNEVFFEALSPTNPAQEARIGHVGLTDLFSTAPSPDDPSFDPHDILVALTDQGGLAPDRSGVHRAGAIDPKAPTATARTMATRLARVIARDLPAGPSWLLPGATKLDPKLADASFCGQCHAKEYEAWQTSAHARAALDPMVRFGAGVEDKEHGAQYSRLCAGCHDPASLRMGDATMQSGRGVTCIGCHDTERLIRAGGNADLDAPAHDWMAGYRTGAARALTTLRKPEFCGGCHQQFVPGTAMRGITTLGEWQASPYAAQDTRCVDCHMPKDNSVADHAMIGGNVYLATKFGDKDNVARVTARLQGAIGLSVVRQGGTVEITITNRGAGHSFPTGVTDIREPWVELQAVDAQGKIVARYGGVGDDGLLPPSAARLGLDIARADGSVLYLHELSQAVRIPFERRVPAKGNAVLQIDAPAALPAGATELDAVLLYRNVRTPYYRAATGDPKGSAPDAEVARVAVP
jgi:DNA-binding beta-propeller fold protein YncE